MSPLSKARTYPRTPKPQRICAPKSKCAEDSARYSIRAVQVNHPYLSFLRNTSMMSCTSLMRRRNAAAKNPAPATAIVARSIASF